MSEQQEQREVEVLGAAAARQGWSALLNRVFRTRQPVIIEKNGIPVAAVVSYHDPHVPALPEKGLESVDLAEAVAAADAVAIVTAHDGIDYQAMVEDAALVIDFRGVTRELAADNVVLL